MLSQNAAYCRERFCLSPIHGASYVCIHAAFHRRQQYEDSFDAIPRLPSRLMFVFFDCCLSSPAVIGNDVANSFERVESKYNSTPAIQTKTPHSLESDMSHEQRPVTLPDSKSRRQNGGQSHHWVVRILRIPECVKSPRLMIPSFLRMKTTL